MDIVSKLSEDPRIDPRIKALFGAFDMPAAQDVASREELIERSNSEEARAQFEGLQAFLAMSDTEEIAPSAGLTVTTETFTSVAGFRQHRQHPVAHPPPTKRRSLSR